MSKLRWGLLLFGLGYFGAAYWPVARIYVKTLFAAHDLMGKELDFSNRYREVAKVLDRLEKDTGHRVYNNDVRIYEDDDGYERVEIKTGLTAEFPFIDQSVTHHVTIRAKGAAR